MIKAASRNIRVGIIVIAGLVVLIGALYMIGDTQNLFGSTITLKTSFNNVKGLTVGNNVRYGGIDVGTVSDIQIVNDTTVLVEMTVESDAMNYIRSNALTSVGTDGLMGNRLVNILPGEGNAAYIKDGTTLEAAKMLDADEMLQTLGVTNDNVYTISQNLKHITARLEEDEQLWSLLKDSIIYINIQTTMQNLASSSEDIKSITVTLRTLTNDVGNSEGLVGTLIYDSTLVINLERAMKNLNNVTDSLDAITTDLAAVSSKVRQGEGAAGTILMDEQFEQDLKETIENVKRASKSLDENMEAMKHSILFRKYFKKQANKEK